MSTLECSRGGQAAGGRAGGLGQTGRRVAVWNSPWSTRSVLAYLTLPYQGLSLPGIGGGVLEGRGPYQPTSALHLYAGPMGAPLAEATQV